MGFGWSFSVSSNTGASAATVVCLRAPWLCEQLCPPRGHAVSHARHPSVRGPRHPLDLCPSLAEPACGQHRGAPDERLGQAAGVPCPGAQPYMQSTSVGILYCVMLYLQCYQIPSFNWDSLSNDVHPGSTCGNIVLLEMSLCLLECILFHMFLVLKLLLERRV